MKDLTPAARRDDDGTGGDDNETQLIDSEMSCVPFAFHPWFAALIVQLTLDVRQ